jgi:hypothetical protein
MQRTTATPGSARNGIARQPAGSERRAGTRWGGAWPRADRVGSKGTGRRRHGGSHAGFDLGPATAWRSGPVPPPTAPGAVVRTRAAAPGTARSDPAERDGGQRPCRRGF